MEATQWILQGGAAAVLLLVLAMLIKGHLRTAWEVEAWRERARRSEQQVDTILPALERLTAAIEQFTQTTSLREHLQ